MKRIVTIGGGTGSYVVLSGLAEYADTLDIVAICTVYDNGRATGRLRDELGALPMGDARRCLIALSPLKSKWRPLLEHRFDSVGGSLNDHNVGNLMMAAGERIWGEESINELGILLQTKGKVVPVSYDKVHLVATLSDGAQVVGESSIGGRSRHDMRTITSLAFTGDTRISDAAAKAVINADVIVVCPGSFYTSIMPCLLTPGMREALERSQAQIVWVPNLMNHPAETRWAKVEDLAGTLLEHIPRERFNAVILNASPIPDVLLKHYADEQGEVLLVSDCASYRECAAYGVPYAQHVLYKDVVSHSGFGANLIRHDSGALAREIVGLTTHPTRKTFVVGIDDVLAQTTRDLRGNRYAVDELVAVPGARAFLEAVRRYGHELVILSSATRIGKSNESEQRKLDVIGVADLCPDVRVVIGNRPKEEVIRTIVRDDKKDTVVVGASPAHELLYAAQYGCSAVIRVALRMREFFGNDIGYVTHTVSDLTDPELMRLVKGK